MGSTLFRFFRDLVNVEECVVRLLTSSAFTKTWTLPTEVTGLEAVHTEVVLLDSRNHLITR